MDDETLKNGRVILTYGRSVMALVAAHSLGKKGIEVIGCDSIDYTVLYFSNHVNEYFKYPDPEKDEEAFLEDILQKVKKYKPEDGRPYVLMPVFNDNEIFARHRDKFEPHIKLACPDYKMMEKLHPKDNFARTTQALDVAVPKTWMPQNEQEIESLCEDLDFPVLIKPYNQVGGRGIHKVGNKEEIIKLWRQNLEKYEQKSLIQDLVEGKDYCLTALFDHGELKASMAYRNLHRFPRGSGAGILRETVPEDRFEKIAVDLMKPIGWNGVAEFDFLWDEKEDSTPALLEVNTRFWGGLFQSVESGIDFPWLLYKLTVVGTVEKAGKPQIGTRTKVPYIWLFSAISDAVSSEEDYQRIKKRGQTALNKMKGGAVLEGFMDYVAYLGAYLGETFNLSKKAYKFSNSLKLSRTARPEFISNDDPYVAFGVLFILGSLIRYGHLPPEVKY